MPTQELDKDGTSGLFKNGADIHFDYNGSNGSTLNQKNEDSHKSSTNRKKKKNKSSVSNEKPSIPNDVHATLNNPEDDYPTSRVIKQAPNGDVIVESLDDHGCEHDHDHDHSHGHNHSHKSHNHTHDHSNPHNNIWDSASLEEQENLKAFWESLDQDKKMELVKIDKKSIMEIFRQENRANHLKSVANNSNSKSGTDNHNHTHNNATSNGNSNTAANSNSNCACKYCGRKSNIIEDELDNIYDNHFDDIIDFIHEVRDINDLNALPGLLFGGFHLLEEEHKLQKRQQKLKNAPQNQPVKKIEPISEKPMPQEKPVEPVPEQVPQPRSFIEDFVDMATDKNLPPSGELTDEQKIYHKLLDPKLFEALENLHFAKPGDNSILTQVNYANLVQKAGSLQEMIKNLQKPDKIQTEQDKFLQNLGNIFGTLKGADATDIQDPNASKFNEQFSQGLSSFAEDLLKNDGHSFIEMMESLSESRTIREDLLHEKVNPTPHQLLEDVQPAPIDKVLPKVTPPILKPAIDDCQDEDEEEDDEEEEDVEEYEDDDENEDEEYGVDEELDEDLEDGEAVSDTESEISEEEKMQEIRRLFLIQVIKIFQERLKNAYKERLSQDRTQQLIEELEAEENAKKERELKKLKQKEKAKEKKRLLQLAKEEEKKKKEEEQQRKEEEQKQKQATLKAEQKRKKEEAKLKREEEKKKKLEEMKRKEEEHKKKVEAQQKREEESKKLKEERRRKIEEEKKKRDEEKKQKELERKKREEGRERTRAERLSSVSEVPLMNEAVSGPSLLSLQDDISNGFEKPTNSNPLLDQLYQAKPRSNSSTPITSLLPDPMASISNTPSTNFMENVGGSSPDLLQNPAGSNVSPNSLYSSMNTNIVGNNNPMAPWARQGSLNSTPQAQNSMLHSSIGNNLFQPLINEPLIGSNNGLNQNSLISDPLNQIGSNTGLNQNSMWNNNSRNSSIWSNTPNLGSATIASTPTFNSSSLWGTSVNPLSNSMLPLQNQAQQFQLQQVAPPPSEVLPDRELVEAASNQAYQSLLSTNQLEFGVAPLHKLFQTTKSILNTQMSLNQYLGLLRSSNLYQIDFIYDDFGTVTHIKMELAHLTQPFIQQQTDQRPSQPPGLTNKYMGMNDASLMNGGGVGTSRGLWN